MNAANAHRERMILEEDASFDVYLAAVRGGYQFILENTPRSLAELIAARARRQAYLTYSAAADAVDEASRQVANAVLNMLVKGDLGRRRARHRRANALRSERHRAMNIAGGDQIETQQGHDDEPMQQDEPRQPEIIEVDGSDEGHQ
ncbi:hypothetical protein V7S43_017959 [Phytophthora oleae]|uniref:Terminase small subunit n=1 Tax=Phytophthora oleae TaxID=2107226 RepID=A0ABD3ERR9_9STRA